MNDALAAVTVVAALAVAAWAGVSCVWGRRFTDPMFYAVVVLELLLVVQLVLASIALAGTARNVDGLTFVSYLVTTVLLPPLVVLWAASDHSRWGTGVVAMMGLVEAVLVVRLLDIWAGRG